MEQRPELKDWKTLLEKQFSTMGYDREDILKIVHMCQDFIGEIQPVSQWIGNQQSFIAQYLRIFSEMYVTRFGEQPPPRPTESPIKEVVLDTPESRKQAVREVALSIAKPGDDVTDEAVLNELIRRGMKMDTPNPTATISTILNGFKPEFEKVEGKRGVFRRQQ